MGLHYISTHKFSNHTLKPLIPLLLSSSLYPSVDMNDLCKKLFPEDTAFESSEEEIIKIPGALVHLIDKSNSVQLDSGNFSIVKLKQGGNVVAILARVGDEIQWPLAKDETDVVKLDKSHYFFTLRVPTDGSETVLNYGLTIASKGQKKLLKKLDEELAKCSAFSKEKVSDKGKTEAWWKVAKEISPEEAKTDKKKGEMLEQSSSAYWTTLAPNVEDYSGSLAKMIAAGSGQVIKGILWCGDVTVDRLKWGNNFLQKRMTKGTESQVSPKTLARIKRVKQLTKMSERVATRILTRVERVSDSFKSKIVNSKPGKKFFGRLPGEMLLASLDGHNKVRLAVELAGRSIMSTSAVVTTELVSKRYGDQAEHATKEALDAVGHVARTALVVSQINGVLNPGLLDFGSSIICDH